MWGMRQRRRRLYEGVDITQVSREEVVRKHAVSTLNRAVTLKIS